MGLTSETSGDFLKGTEKTGPGMPAPRNANSILKNMPPPEPQMNIFDTVIRAMGQGQESQYSSGVPQTLRQESPYWQKAGDASDAIGFQAGNGAMAGIPGAAIAALGKKSPSTGNALMDAALSTGGGMAGAPGALSNVAAQGIKNPLIAGALRGGSFMGAMPGDLASRGKNALIGAAVGAPLEFGTDLAVKGVKAAAGLPSYLKEVITSGGKLKDVEGQLKNVSNEMGSLTAPRETAYGPLTDGQGTQLGQKVLSKAGKSMTGEVEAAGAKSADTMTKNYKAQKTVLGNDLSKATQEETKSYKEALDEVEKQNSSIYGERLDQLQSDLKEPITAEEYNQKVIQPSLKQIAEKRLPLGGPESAIKSWGEKFTPAPAEEPAPAELDYSKIGMVQEPPPAAEPTPPLTLRGLNNIKNEVFNSQSYGARTGSARPDPQDIAADIFYKNHKSFMNERVPGHAELQGDYGPVAESTRDVHKAIRPGEEDLQPGMNMLQKAARGKANPAKAAPDIENALSRVENGSGGFKGTGNLRQKSTRIAEDMQTLGLKFNGNKENLISQIDNKVAEINKSFEEDRALIQRGGRENRENMLKEQASLSQRKASLEARQQDLQKLKTIRDWAGGAIAGTTGLEGVWKFGKKISGH